MHCNLHEAVLEYSANAYSLLTWNKHTATLDRSAIAQQKPRALERFIAATVNDNAIGALSHVVVSVFQSPARFGLACHVAIGVLADNKLSEECVIEVDRLEFSMFVVSIF
jgi:hypothetical protein